MLFKTKEGENYGTRKFVVTEASFGKFILMALILV